MKDDRVYLQHIQDAVSRIARYTADGREVFFTNSQIQDAVARNLEIIHKYFGIDWNIVWNVVEQQVPVLARVVRQALL